MKKLLNGILASSLILSMGAVSFASELPETQNISVDTEVLHQIETKTLSSMSLEVASAYAGVIENIISKYGDNPSKEREYEETGLSFSKLVDLDGDSVSELYVAYVSEHDDDTPSMYCITEEIWTYESSSAKKLHSNQLIYEGGNFVTEQGSFLLPHEGRTLWVSYDKLANNMGSYNHSTIYEYKNGSFSVFESLKTSLSAHSSGEKIDITYTINGSETKVVSNLGIFDNPLWANFSMIESDLFSKSQQNYQLNSREDLVELFSWEYQNCLPQLQAIASQSSSKTATPSTAKVMVNGKEVNFGAYNIDGFNFYKLTDVSFALNGTGKQFEVTWDGDVGAINMKIGSPHIVLGSELQGTSGTNKIAEEMDVKVLKNSALVSDLIVYSIDGSSYFQLDKLKGELGIDVGWDGATSTITITT